MGMRAPLRSLELGSGLGEHEDPGGGNAAGVGGCRKTGDSSEQQGERGVESRF